MKSAANTHPRLAQAIELLSRLIATPSLSRNENDAAEVWETWLAQHGAIPRRIHNNVYAVTPHYDPAKPVLMLNSHMDTVKPAASYTRDPFLPEREGERLYGLGSNDAGASAVALACTFLDLMNRGDLPVTLLLAISSEEEVSGERGTRALLPHLLEKGLYPDMAIVGEPTGMHPAIAERGLLVVDCTAKGKSGHAARGEGINAIYRAMEDIGALRNFSPERVSETLGPISVNVTMVNAGTQHNVVPDTCTYVADIRTTDAYTNPETVELLRRTVKWSTLEPRSTRIQASVISRDHPLVKAAVKMGKKTFVSPTTSDMALMHGFPTLKIGPGESSRSHSADEYILLSEINEALEIYPELVKNATE